MNNISGSAIIGKNVSFGSNVTVYANSIIEDNCVIFDNVQIGFPNNHSISSIKDTGMLECTSQKTIIGAGAIIRSGAVIYEDVHIGPRSDIAHYVIIRSGCRIGGDFLAYPHSVLHEDVIAGDNLRLGGIICNRCILGNRVVMMGKLVHRFDRRSGTKIEESPVLEDDVFVAYDATVVGGIRVEKGTIVKSNTLVWGN